MVDRQVGDQDGMVHEANIAEWLPGLGPEMVGHNFPLIDLRVRGSGGGGGDMDAGLS